jgi:hypothetical protein
LQAIATTPDNRKKSGAKLYLTMPMARAKTAFVLGAASVGLAVVAAFTLSPLIGSLAALTGAAAWYSQHRVSTDKEATVESRLEELRVRALPRTLTSAQMSSITSAMKRFAKLQNENEHQSAAVFATSTAFESTSLPDQIAAALVAATWTINRYPVTFGMAFSVSGVGILTSSNTRGIEIADALAALLNSHGILASVIPDKRRGCEEMENMTAERIASDPFCSQISILVGDHP